MSCRYGTSPLTFRGPERPLTEETCVVLGGAAIWGQGWERPLPLRLEEATGRPVANLGVRGGGLDTILGDPVLVEAVRRARVTIVEALGGQNLSNAYYDVHPRRNDRFVAPKPALRALYDDVDVTGICFNRHLLSTLIARSPRRFALVAAELRAVWMRRMRALAALAEGRLVLLWVGAPAPLDGTLRRLGPEPMLVTGTMLSDLRPVLRVVEVRPDPRAGADREAEVARALVDLVR